MVSYRILFEYWGRGLLVAAIISAILGLLIGDAVALYFLAGLCLILSLACIFISRRLRDLGDVKCG
ncbi:MAG TPA: hypothetical protein VJ857_04085 [Methanocorpusculum sp.]|nr:hypothetical protein [Methanocorpusculum sp.]